MENMEIDMDIDDEIEELQKRIDENNALNKRIEVLRKRKVACITREQSGETDGADTIVQAVYRVGNPAIGARVHATISPPRKRQTILPVADGIRLAGARVMPGTAIAVSSPQRNRPAPAPADILEQQQRARDAEMEELMKQLRAKDAEMEQLRKQMRQPRPQRNKRAAAAPAAAPKPKPRREDVCKDIVEGDMDELGQYVANIVDEIAKTVIKVRKTECEFGDKCNFDINKIIESVASISEIADVIMQSPTQTDKTYGIAALAIIAKKLGIPFMCFVLTQKSDVHDMCNEKVKDVLAKFGIETLFINNTKQFWKMSDADVNLFKKGDLAIFAQGVYNNIDAAYEFIETREVYNISLCLDEADKFHSSDPDDLKTRKETAMQMLKTSSLDPKAPLNAHIRCVHYISATSLPVKAILEASGRPFESIIADTDQLKNKGYALPDSIKVLEDGQGRKLYLDLSKHVKKQGYNLYSREVEAMMDKFVDDMIELDPTTNELRRTGGMLMAALTPFINENDKDRVINATVAKHLMTMFRNKAKAKIIDAGRELNGNDIAVIGLVKRGGGMVDRYTITWDSDDIRWEVLQTPIGKVIEDIDESDLKIPIIMSSYNSSTRNVSVRSGKRVITHVIACSTKYVNWADNDQRNTRYGGSTTDIRTKNGFDCVLVLMEKFDAERHPIMYDTTNKFLANNGNEMDVETAESMVRMANVRPLAAGGLGKFIEHNMTQHIEKANGRPTQEYHEKKGLNAEKKAEMNQLKEANSKSAADDRDNAIAMEQNNEIVDPGPGIEVSVPMAVRISRLLHATTRDVQVPAVYETETSQKIMTRATAEAFEHFQTEFGVTFPKVVVAKAKDGEDAKYAYKFTSKYDPTGRSLCGRVIHDAYRIRSENEMKCTAYVLYRMDGNPAAAGGSSDVPRTLEWKFVEDKETKRIMACYSVRMTDLATVVKDCESANQFVPSTVRSERNKLLFRFFALNPGFVGTVRHITHALPIFNKDIVDEINKERKAKDKSALIYGSDFAGYVANNIMEAVTVSVYRILPTYKWNINA